MSIEEITNYWNNQPCNIKHSNKEIGSKEYFEEVTKRKYLVEPHILEFANFSKYRNKKVLEIGCGIGTTAQSFMENGSIYEGIDISEKSINIAKKRLDIFNLTGKFSVQNIEEYLSNVKYDLVYSFGVLHHTPNIKRAIDNIYDLLEEGGEFKLMLYAKNSLKYFKIKDGLEQYEAQNCVPIANVYTNEEVHKLLENFKNIEIIQTHIFPYKIKEYKEYKYIKEDYFDCMSQELFKCLEKNLGWHLCITCNK
jgi:2-polyprenyl-3-methyl-5-hydroxy-6-metoxy-1,4-benzoquinol methylase